MCLTIWTVDAFLTLYNDHLTIPFPLYCKIVMRYMFHVGTVVNISIILTTTRLVYHQSTLKYLTLGLGIRLVPSTTVVRHQDLVLLSNTFQGVTQLVLKENLISINCWKTLVPTYLIYCKKWFCEAGVQLFVNPNEKRKTFYKIGVLTLKNSISHLQLMFSILL